MTSRLFRICLAVMVVASIFQAYAMGYIWGIDSQQSRIDELRDENFKLRYPARAREFLENICTLYQRPNPAKVKLGFTGIILTVSWVGIALMWITRPNDKK